MGGPGSVGSPASVCEAWSGNGGPGLSPAAMADAGVRRALACLAHVFSAEANWPLRFSRGQTGMCTMPDV